VASLAVFAARKKSRSQAQREPGRYAKSDLIANINHGGFIGRDPSSGWRKRRPSGWHL